MNLAIAKEKAKKYTKQHTHKKDKKHDHSDQTATVKRIGKKKLTVKVNGMVCAFCAQGIEKNFNQQEEVQSTKVDLDTMEVTIHLKAGKNLAEEKIKEIVTSAGFSYVELKE